MKLKLNITIDQEVLRKAKQYARKKDTSISSIVEDHFRALVMEPPKKTLLNIIDSLPAAGIKGQQNLKSLYYKEKGAKHG